MNALFATNPLTTVHHRKESYGCRCSIAVCHICKGLRQTSVCSYCNLRYFLARASSRFHQNFIRSRSSFMTIIASSSTIRSFKNGFMRTSNCCPPCIAPLSSLVGNRPKIPSRAAAAVHHSYYAGTSHGTWHRRYSTLVVGLCSAGILDIWPRSSESSREKSRQARISMPSTVTSSLFLEKVNKIFVLQFSNRLPVMTNQRLLRGTQHRLTQ